MSNATIIDEKVLNDCLNEIARALRRSDVQFELVRDMKTNIKKIVSLDDLAAGHDKRKIIQQVSSMLPGFSAGLMPKGSEKERQAMLKRYMTMMDSMTNEELDSSNPKLMNESRMMRIARGSGRHVREVMEMMEEYKGQAKVYSNKMMKGLKIPKKGEMSALSRNMNAQHLSKVLPPRMLKEIGGMVGLQNLMKQMGSPEDMFGGGDK